MLRLLGAVLLVAGGAGLGLAAVGRMQRRVAALCSLVDALERLEQELGFRLPPMKEWMTGAARRSAPPAARFLEACAQGLDDWEGRPLSELWRRSALETLPMLRQSDLEPLFAVGQVLGRYDADSQRQALEEARERLSRAANQASEERRRQGRVYGVLGATAGAFLVILLV